MPTTGSNNQPVKGPGQPAVAEKLLQYWLECIRTRQPPVANAEVAYWSTMACFMGNQACQARSRVAWDHAWDLPA